MALKPTKHNQTIKSQIFLDYFPIEKNRPRQIQTQDLCRPRRIRYLQTKCTGDAKKLNSL